MCNTKLIEIILGIIILILAISPAEIYAQAFSSWTIVVCAAILIIHAVFFLKPAKISKEKTEIKKKKRR